MKQLGTQNWFCSTRKCNLTKEQLVPKRRVVILRHNINEIVTKNISSSIMDTNLLMVVLYHYWENNTRQTGYYFCIWKKYKYKIASWWSNYLTHCSLYLQFSQYFYSDTSRTNIDLLLPESRIFHRDICTMAQSK